MRNSKKIEANSYDILALVGLNRINYKPLFLSCTIPSQCFAHYYFLTSTVEFCRFKMIVGPSPRAERKVVQSHQQKCKQSFANGL